MIFTRVPMKKHSSHTALTKIWASSAHSVTSVESNTVASAESSSASCYDVDDTDEFASDSQSDHALPAKSETGKRVRFSSTARQRSVRSHRTMSEQHKALIWYNQKQSQRIVTKVQHAALVAVNVKRNYSKALDQVCKDVCFLTTSMDNYEIHALLTDVDFLHNTAESLLACQSGDDNDTFRGLEDLVSRERQYVRFEQAPNARKVVVHMSQNFDTMSDETAQHYKDLSMPSVVLARLVGMADAAAAEDVQDDAQNRRA